MQESHHMLPITGSLLVPVSLTPVPKSRLKREALAMGLNPGMWLPESPPKTNWRLQQDDKDRLRGLLNALGAPQVEETKTGTPASPSVRRHSKVIRTSRVTLKSRAPSKCRT